MTCDHAGQKTGGEDECTYQKSRDVVYGKHDAEKEVKVVAEGPQWWGTVCAPDIQDYKE